MSFKPSRRCPISSRPITAGQREQLYHLMLDAFASRDALDRLLWLKLDQDLNKIVAENRDHGQVMLEVLRRAERQNWLDRLVAAALAERPDREDLRRWAEMNMPALDATDEGPPRIFVDLDELRGHTEPLLGPDCGLRFASVEVVERSATVSARQEAAQRRVLVQVQCEALAQDGRTRFEQESGRARTASSHTHVADVLSWGLMANGYPFVVQSIDHSFQPYRPPLSPLEVLDIGAKLADALSVAHSSSATFGEITPAHVVKTGHGEPLLIVPRLPMFARPGLAPFKPHEDVSRLCQVLLAMRDGHWSNEHTDAPGETVEQRLLALLHTGKEGGLIAGALRDQLETLRRESAPASGDAPNLARLVVDGVGGRSEIVIVEGDLFAQDADIVIGFSDTFDTATADSLVISSASIQGQLVKRVYGGRGDLLDDDLDRALAGTQPASLESRAAKQHGKLKRYPIGTVVALEHSGRRILGVAISQMGNNLVAHSNDDFIRLSLEQLWAALGAQAPTRTVAMPVIGSGLARVSLSRESLVELIVESFRQRASRAPICRALRIVVHSSDAASIDLSRIVR